MQQEESTVLPHAHVEGPDPRIQDDRGKGAASLSAAAAIASQALAADFNAARVSSYHTLRNGAAGRRYEPQP